VFGGRGPGRTAVLQHTAGSARSDGVRVETRTVGRALLPVDGRARPSAGQGRGPGSPDDAGLGALRTDRRSRSASIRRVAAARPRPNGATAETSAASIGVLLCRDRAALAAVSSRCSKPLTPSRCGGGRRRERARVGRRAPAQSSRCSGADLRPRGFARASRARRACAPGSGPVPLSRTTRPHGFSGDAKAPGLRDDEPRGARRVRPRDLRSSFAILPARRPGGRLRGPASTVVSGIDPALPAGVAPRAMPRRAARRAGPGVPAPAPDGPRRREF
jgi:hypothetical protein